MSPPAGSKLGPYEILGPFGAGTREPTRDKLHVLHNWFEELKRLDPDG